MRERPRSSNRREVWFQPGRRIADDVEIEFVHPRLVKDQVWELGQPSSVSWTLAADDFGAPLLPGFQNDVSLTALETKRPPSRPGRRAGSACGMNLAPVGVEDTHGGRRIVGFDHVLVAPCAKFNHKLT
jgi:hypothetical protein